MIVSPRPAVSINSNSSLFILFASLEAVVAASEQSTVHLCLYLAVPAEPRPGFKDLILKDVVQALRGESAKKRMLFDGQLRIAEIHGCAVSTEASVEALLTSDESLITCLKEEFLSVATRCQEIVFQNLIRFLPVLRPRWH